MAVFVAYSDETELFGPDDTFLMGGYVSNESDWPWVETAWQERVLDGSPRLPYLHMREINNEEWRTNSGISYNEAQERISEAARVMQSFGNMAAIISTARRSDVNAVFNRANKKKRYVPVGLDEPDYFCFVAYATFILAQVHRKWPEAQKVNFIISEKQIVSDHIKEFKQSMCELLKHDGLKELLGEVIPLKMANVIPLQASDVLMWHVQRYYAAGKNQFKMHPCDRMRAAKLIQDGTLDGTVHEWSRSEMEDMANKFIASGFLA